VDPADQVLYVAAHGGVFRLADGALELVANRAQDTMGFTVVGPRHFLASGHPAPTDRDRPGHLGLIESRDAAATWTDVSLSGKADFHSIEPAPGRVYGYDSQTGTVMATTDHATWVPLMRGDVYDLAAHPSRPNHVLATTGRGVVQLIGTKQTELSTPTELAVLEWPADNLLVGVNAKGAVYRSPDGGTTWAAAGQVPGAVEAFSAETTGWFVATDEGIFSSTDLGTRWVRIL